MQETDSIEARAGNPTVDVSRPLAPTWTINNPSPRADSRWTGAAKALRHHWPEYLMEAAGLGLFMISACVFAILLEHPGSPVHWAIASEFERRALMGLAMGLTAVGIIYSPWGKQSGAHLNPAVTLTFFRMGKVSGWDTLFYTMAQLTGGVAGVLIAAASLGPYLSHPAINYVATLPGASGATAAFLGEFLISFLLMTVVLAVSNHERFAPFTGILAGLCVALFITFEAPISGMSINPARTLASALPSGMWRDAWIYFVAPPGGMSLAATVRKLWRMNVACAKLHHRNNKRCIFCDYQLGRP